MDYNQLSFAVRLLDPLKDQPPVSINRRTIERIPCVETERLLQLFFGDSQKSFLSRNDVLKRKNRDRELFTLTVLFWGFPGNQHNVCTHAFQSWNHLTAWCSGIGRVRNITPQQYALISQQMQNLHGLGISTFSKLFYYSSNSIDGHPCLILDNQVAKGIQLLQGPEFIELKDAVAPNHYRKYQNYPLYLAAMDNLANRLTVSGDRIEYVLWLAGKKRL